MSQYNDAPPETKVPVEYLRFLRLLNGIASVPKAAIYKLDPRLKRKRMVKEMTSSPPQPGRQ